MPEYFVPSYTATISPFSLSSSITTLAMGPRKRSRPVEDYRTQCPFKVILSNKPLRADYDRDGKKRGKCTGRNNAQHQTFHFFEDSSLDVNYIVNRIDEVGSNVRWQAMTRYSTFVLNKVRYAKDDFVRVANEWTIERQRAAVSSAKDGRTKVLEKDWAARILDIRATDEHHVYALVCWMYSPDELSTGTICGKKSIQGRQPYHGLNELIASNHMDIINVVSVIEPAAVSHWSESDEEDLMNKLYWRQTYNCLNSQLSPAKLVCECMSPENPDAVLIGCSSTTCGEWMHQECLHDDVLMRVYNQLGTDKPRLIEPMSSMGDDSVTSSARPLSSEGVAKEALQLISDEVQNGVRVLEATIETLEAAGPRTKKFGTDAQRKPPANKNRKESADFKPYVGPFRATLILDEGLTKWKICDSRDNILDGEKTWEEKAYCLLCGVIIN
ncbi:hypothetical protein B0T10DRAFT_499817 [Thelonectria olida]|uniref:BAH domain-containing protein n=1 Tax=Thelonectria olida TaxID=1576542 RepID=A0A9P8VU84_9HYPO|nr:hypothetical protein B0T10DRAFT_499817 [Thelonectria olida]